jgi:hypothetical protein
MSSVTGFRGVLGLAPAFCVTMHVVALAAMGGLLRGGMLTEPDVAARAQFVADHATGWTIGWGLCMLAGLSIVLFYAWWAMYLRGATAATGVILAAAGMACDWTGEAIFAFSLVESAISPDTGYAPFLQEERSATLLTAGAANFLYTLGGMLLMLATLDLPKWIRIAMWGTWIAGFGMTASALFMYVPGIVVATVVLFPLLLIWVSWMGLRWRPA